MFDNLNLFDLEDMQDLTVVYVGGGPYSAGKTPYRAGKVKGRLSDVHPPHRQKHLNNLSRWKSLYIHCCKKDGLFLSFLQRLRHKSTG